MDPAFAGALRAKREIPAILGFDFGTSCTKLVVRLPYEAGEPAFAVPAPQYSIAEEHPHLCTSRVWLDGNGVFRLAPNGDSRQIAYVKSALMGEAQGGIEWHADSLVEEAVAAFLGLLIWWARQWFSDRHRDLVGPNHLDWSYHFGFPAASLGNARLRSAYERCAAAALRVTADGSVSLPAVRDALALVSRESEAALTEFQGAVFPEIAAAVAGFAHSQRREDGLYALIDVGGGTLDCCTFNLTKSTHGPVRCPIFAADVAMLGVEPWLACRDRSSSEDFRKELDRRPRTVIWQTRHSRYRESPRWDDALPLFLVGGGAASDVHRAMADNLHGWLRCHLKTGRGGVRRLELPRPQNLFCACSHHQVRRLEVAVGLSLPSDLIPTVELPNLIEDESPPQPRDWESWYIDKSMT